MDLFKNVDEPTFDCEIKLRSIGFWMTAFKAGTGRSIDTLADACGVSSNFFDVNGMLFLTSCCESGLGANLGYGIDDLLTLIAAHFCIEDGCRF